MPGQWQRKARTFSYHALGLNAGPLLFVLCHPEPPTGCRPSMFSCSLGGIECVGNQVNKAKIFPLSNQ